VSRPGVADITHVSRSDFLQSDGAARTGVLRSQRDADHDG